MSSVSFRDRMQLAFGAVLAQRTRSWLSALGIAVGVCAVLLLGSLGEGVRRYVVGQFTQFGTNLLKIAPGKTETVGIPGVFGGSTKKLTIDDAEAIAHLPHVEKVVPLSLGQARVEGNGRGRSVMVYGVTSDAPEVWKFGVRQGTFLAPGDPRRGRPIAVLGPKLKQELFGEENALGRFVRIAGVRLRVVGVMEPKGRVLSFDIDDSAYIPVATAMRMFNMDELNEIDVLFSSGHLADQVAASIEALLKERHGGEEDVTVTTQTEMLDVFGRVISIVTFAVGAIAGVSLLVGAIGILTTMWIAVSQRTREIGLLRALGATPAAVARLFLLEAALLATAGGVAGLVAGILIIQLGQALVPELPLHVPAPMIAAAVGVSVLTGLITGFAPARRAARLDPVDALRAE